jgi:hypothetical protein
VLELSFDRKLPTSVSLTDLNFVEPVNGFDAELARKIGMFRTTSFCDEIPGSELPEAVRRSSYLKTGIVVDNTGLARTPPTITATPEHVKDNIHDLQRMHLNAIWQDRLSDALIRMAGFRQSRVGGAYPFPSVLVIPGEIGSLANAYGWDAERIFGLDIDPKHVARARIWTTEVPNIWCGVADARMLTREVYERLTRMYKLPHVVHARHLGIWLSGEVEEGVGGLRQERSDAFGGLVDLTHDQGMTFFEEFADFYPSSGPWTDLFHLVDDELGLDERRSQVGHGTRAAIHAMFPGQTLSRLVHVDLPWRTMEHILRGVIYGARNELTLEHNAHANTRQNRQLVQKCEELYWEVMRNDALLNGPAPIQYLVTQIVVDRSGFSWFPDARRGAAEATPRLPPCVSLSNAAHATS